MKYYKVNIHTKTYANADLVINRKDFFDIQLNDIVEIYHPEDEFSRLLLQVTVFKDDLPGKDVVSIDQGIANTFQIRSFSDVVIRKVDLKSVMLDSVEVTFKDQYLGRSEMWRLRNSLINSCVHLNKKIEFCNGNARVQVCEMWYRGIRVACGLVTEETKLVFRSSTSMVFLFIQMSSEMWEIDVHGNLYFEKAINGFLTDLFHKWKKYGSNHEVTIVLFSRVFYKASSLDEFPDHMHESLQKDYKNRFYEDFYRVAVQNEKYDDWNSSIVLLQSLFTGYRETILDHHKRTDCKIPAAFLSTAAHGNFLEVLNISLNVFDKHYLERSMDRTGQVSVVISPGVGVFEVDRELTNVTKQRIIDNGVGCDLVCVGEQPLHAVPLFKFHNKDKTILRNDYSMPHWINLSFYSGSEKLAFSKFVPRIRLPSHPSTAKIVQPQGSPSFINSRIKLPTSKVEETLLLGCSVSTTDVNYDEYDDHVFTLPSTHIESVQKLFSRTRKLSCSQDTKAMKWKLSDPDIYRSTMSITRSTSIATPETRTTNELIRTFSIYTNDRIQNQKTKVEVDNNLTLGVVGVSADFGSKNLPQKPNLFDLGNSPLGPGRALINPFDPSHVTVKLTSNRRRWTHIFPRGPSGNIIQQHHCQPKCEPLIEMNEKSEKTLYETNVAIEDDLHSARFSPTVGCKVGSKGSTCIGSPNSIMCLVGRKTQTLLWGATGEQQWTPSLTTGVDWKSLIIPACLPITTDYFPDEVCLKTDYVFSDYNLLPDDVNADYARKRAIYRAPLTTHQVFFELISQRLAQGFQLIIDGDINSSATKGQFALVPQCVSEDTMTECKLSIGRIFHRITLCGSEIRITRYRPRFPYPPFKIPYRYQFQVPNRLTYGASNASFEAEKLENFNWNYLDHYICTRGDTDFALIKACKYWRFRLYVLPGLQTGTKKILDGAARCDVYVRSTYEEKLSLQKYFLKFIEIPVNKIRKMLTPDVPSKVTGGINITGTFRDKGGNINRERIAQSSSESLKPTRECITNVELVDMMSHPINGVKFLSRCPSLPSCTFISYNAVQWLKTHIGGVTDDGMAISQLEELRKEKLICHASGNFSHPFLYGFFLYHIPCRKIKFLKDKPADLVEPIYDEDTFKNEWAEIEMLPVLAKNHLCPVFLLRNLPEVLKNERALNQNQELLYREVYLDIDPNNRSDRIEWGHFQYQSMFLPENAYELVIKWIAASGPIVSDLITSLARKAQAYNLQLVPVPADPHALPYSVKSDPLRGPIFIPLNINVCWSTEKNVLFEEFPEETHLQRILLFLEEIAIRFGFIPCQGGPDDHCFQNQYVHVTGNIFLLITLPMKKTWFNQQEISIPTLSRKCLMEEHVKNKSKIKFESIISPYQNYVRKLLIEQKKKNETDDQIGYLWSWNHMIGKRWKFSNIAINDEAFQDKLLLDFQKFCSNDENRLYHLWDKCFLQKKK